MEVAMKAIGYVRVSRVGHRVGDSFLSPELKRESIERVCHREGLELAEVVEELDKSGGDAARPLWNKAIERVERGEVGALVVWISTASVGASLTGLTRSSGSKGREGGS